MKRYLIVTLASFGFATGVNAQPGPADLQAIAGNLQPTVEALTTGLQDTAETLANTQSAVQTSAALGDTAVNTTGALVQDAPSLGALGFGANLMNQAIQQNLNPVLATIDNPSQDNINRVFNPQDLNTIAGNLEDTPQALWAGTLAAGNNQGLQDATVALLEGNLVDPALIPGPSVVSSPGFALASGTYTLLDGTNYGGVLVGDPGAGAGAGIPVTIALANTVANGAIAPSLVPVEEGLAPAFDAAAPATDPVIDGIQGIEL